LLSVTSGQRADLEGARALLTPGIGPQVPRQAAEMEGELSLCQM
jgi:hypothetical protein